MAVARPGLGNGFIVTLTFFTRRVVSSIIQQKTTAMDPATRSQTTNRVLMVTPTVFCYNSETAGDNEFQKELKGLASAQVVERAASEFEGLKNALSSRGIEVNVVEDTLMKSGDAVFPNNWISFHRGKIALYPMLAINRRTERRADVVERWKKKLGATVVDYTRFEEEDMFLEGTGSLVLDRTNRIAYACKSQRTDAKLVQKFCDDFNYSPVLFSASTLKDGAPRPIYHTNVMMSVCETFAVVCLESIRDHNERKQVVSSLETTDKEIIDITEKQVHKFAGNVLQLQNVSGEKFLVMSTRAFSSFSTDQLAVIAKHCTDTVHSPLETIEDLGGGGARCMLAEIFPPVH